MSEYPRVTEILKPFTSYESVPQDVLTRAASRGTQVHAICAGIAKGAWIPDGMIDPEFLGYINSFKLWAEAQVSKYVIVEKRYMDDAMQYSGQMDFVIEGKDGKTYLIDIKTSAKPQKTYPIQMAAYENLLEVHGVTIHGAMLVYLSKTGEFPNIDLLEDMSSEMTVFTSALTCWNYFHTRKHARRKKKTQ